MKTITMKRPGLLVSLLALVLFSCSDKDSAALKTTDSLEGNWRMVAVKDNSTGFIHTKPGAITGDVDITFVAVNTTDGFINGKTPTNTLYADYAIGAIDIISIPSVASTKVAETSWGIDFLYSITFADSYSFEDDGKLRIHTKNKTLFFKKN